MISDRLYPKPSPTPSPKPSWPKPLADLMARIEKRTSRFEISWGRVLAGWRLQA